MGFSDLKDDLYVRGCVQDSKCGCGATKEDASHYFLHCGRFKEIRREMFNCISTINENLNISTALLLYGSDMLRHDQNLNILSCVYKFLEKSNRF